MSELQPDHEWKEVGRWLKFEETVENGGRWSKPHVGTLQLHYLLELKHFLSHGTIILDLCGDNLGDIIGKLGVYHAYRVSCNFHYNCVLQKTFWTTLFGIHTLNSSKKTKKS